MMELINIDKKIHTAKLRLLEMHYKAKVGHIGGNLSALDSLMVLHHNVMRKNDTFILSKGHSAGALYITLWSLGLLSDADLATFHKDNTKLAGHPISGWISQIPLSTGSLGHGFPVALGIALGKKLAHVEGHVYCLTSDGEWQEGSMWEALIFMAHHKLNNFTLLIDCNGLQGFGSTQEVASMKNLKQRISAFDVSVIEVEGHEAAEIQQVIQQNPGSVVILNTVKGNGVSFMENSMDWHYLALTDELYKQAVNEVKQNAK